MSGLTRCDAETLLEGRREVRDIFETYIEAGVGNTAATLEKFKGCSQTAICEPSLR